MRAPEFWAHNGLAARLLTPLSHVYGWAVRRKMLDAAPAQADVPVICVGNIVAGGAGKTPVCIALAERLRLRGRNPHFLTRGYGGSEIGPLAVDARHHGVSQIGDEALLLVRHAPTWVSANRPKGAAEAAAMGADVVVMDDGFQNFSLHKDLSLAVVDGGYGFGNGRVIPAGPCRETPHRGLARADAVVLIGEDRRDVAGMCRDVPVLRARLAPDHGAAAVRGKTVIAFAGIGRPQKFFETLEECGAELAAVHCFPDHHPYCRREIETLLEQAARAGAMVATTAKDAVRLPADLRDKIAVLAVSLLWDDASQLDRLLDRLP